MRHWQAYIQEAETLLEDADRDEVVEPTEEALLLLRALVHAVLANAARSRFADLPERY